MHKYQNDILASNPASVSLTADAEGRIRGYGAIFGNVDRGGDRIIQGAFTKSLAAQRAEGFLPIMAWMHDMGRPIGKWTVIKEDAKGLWVEGQLNLATTLGKDTCAHIAAGDIGGLSIGYKTPKGGRKYAGKGVFDLSELEVWEVSVVAIPMNPKATIQEIKSKSEAIEVLRGVGFSKKAATRFAGGGWSALGGGYDETKLARLAASIEAATTKMKG